MHHRQASSGPLWACSWCAWLPAARPGADEYQDLGIKWASGGLVAHGGVYFPSPQELEGHHILALSSDKPAIVEALAPVRKKNRPGISARHGADRRPRTSLDASSSSGGALGADASIDNRASLDAAAGDNALIDDLVNDAVLEVVHAIRTDSSLAYPEYRPADARGAGPMY